MIISIVVGAVVGLVVGIAVTQAIGYFAMRHFRRSMQERTDALLQIGMNRTPARERGEALLQIPLNRASFPMCSPSRFPVTMRRVSGYEMVTRSDWNMRPNSERLIPSWDGTFIPFEDD